MCSHLCYMSLFYYYYPVCIPDGTQPVSYHYSENVVAKKYIDLYNKVTGRNA